ncbi:hypothetical protein TURU_062332 [Turdus rufiventris]|nr:hypothetical protein TURU_062332 [Turdus rufiventris]
MNLLKFKKAKCKVLHLSQGNPKHKYRLDREWIETRSGEKDLGVLVEENLNVTQKYMITVWKANCILGCIKSSMASWPREGILWSHETPSGVLSSLLELPTYERH